MFFISFPIFLLLYEHREMKALELEMEIQNILELAGPKLETVHRSATREVQLRELISSFESSLSLSQMESRDATIMKAKDYYAMNLAKILPPHDLVLAEVSSDSVSILFRSGTARHDLFPMNEELKKFILWFNGDNRNDKALSVMISETLGFAFILSPARRFLLRENLTFFQGTDFRGAIYGNLLSRPASGTKMFFGIVFDLEKTDPLFGSSTLANSWQDQSCGLAFIPANGSAPIVFSPFFKSRDEIKNHLSLLAKNQVQLLTPQIVDETLLIMGNYTPELPVQAVLAYPLSVTSAGRNREAILTFLCGLFLILCLFFLTERIFFNRGPRFSVGLSLLGTFILVSLLPITGVIGLGNRYASENQRKERGNIASQLSGILNQIDGAANFFSSRVIQKMKNICTNPGIALELYKAEKKQAIKTPDSNSPGKSSNNESNTTMKKMAQTVTGNLKGEETISSVVVAGPGNFILDWRRFNPNSETADVDQQMFRVVTALSKDYLVEMNPLPKQITFQESRGKDSANSLEAQTKEAFIEMLQENAGPEVLVNFLKYPKRVSEILIGPLKMSFMIVPIYWEALPRYIVVWSWTNGIIDKPFLQQTLNSKTKKNKYTDIFADSSIGQSSSEDSSIPPGLSKFGQLMRLGSTVRTSGTALRSFSEEEQVIREARPSRNISGYILFGQRSTSHLITDAQNQSRLFLCLIIAMLVLTILVSVNAAEYFLSPLRKFLRALSQIEIGKYETSLDEVRTDEFGSLGRAFNSMVTKLREGKLLGRYVSRWVHDAVNDDKFFAAARQGENIDVTVLFSNLVGFNEFENSAAPEEIFRVLEMHLSAMNKAVGEFKGEIDKVLGDKILVIFIHRNFGGPENAIKAAFNVMNKVREELARISPLPPAMGLNTGTAIVGILGAKSFRLDYTVIGDTVNLAARLATLALITNGTRVVVSGRTLSAFGNQVKTEKLPFKRVKGKTQEVEAHLLLD